MAASITALTQHEIAILRLLAAGHSPKQIARTLGKAERTVRHQMESARRHLGAATMLAAMVMAADAGLLHPDKPA